MTKINRFANHLFLFITVIFSATSPCLSAISDRRLCFDPNCSEPVSLARAVTSYSAAEPSILSFRIDANVTIYSKGAGNRTDLWGVEINGKRGYVPYTFLKEYKVLRANLTCEVPTSKSGKNINEKDDQNANGKKKLEVISTEKKLSHDTSDTLKVIPAVEEVQVSTTTTQNLPHAFNVVEGTTLPFDNIQSHVHASRVVETIETTTVSVLGPNETPTVVSDNNFCGEDGKCKESEDIVESLDGKEKYSVPTTSAVENINETSGTDNSIKGSVKSLNNTLASVPPDYFETVQDSTTNITQSEQKIDVLANDSTDRGTYNAIETKAEVAEDHNGSEKKSLQSQWLYLHKDKTNNNVQVSSVVPDLGDGDEKFVPVAEDMSVPAKPETIDTEKSAEEMTRTCRQNDLFSIKLPLSDSAVATEADQVPNDGVEIESPVEDNIMALPNEEIENEHVLKHSTNIIPENIGVDNKDNIPAIESPIANQEESANSDINSNDNLIKSTSSADPGDEYHHKQQQQPLLHSTNETAKSEDGSHQTIHSMDFPRNRNLLNVEENVPEDKDLSTQREEESDQRFTREILPEHEDDMQSSEDTIPSEYNADKDPIHTSGTPVDTSHDDQVQDSAESDEDFGVFASTMEHNYWETIIYVAITACTTLVFSLGYYYIENVRRDSQLIGKVNKLEKELLVSSKECTMLDESLKSAKTKLARIEDESFGSNEMVLSLKTDLETSQNAKAELEDHVASLEKDLESATEAGLELERMLRELLSSNNEVNPLAQSVEDLQARLNAQQAANESLTNALNLRAQENETLLVDLDSAKRRCEEMEVELARVTADLKLQTTNKNNVEDKLNDRIRRLEIQIKEISTEKSTLSRELKTKEVEIKDVVEAMNQLNSNDLDIDKLYDVSRVKAEAAQLLEERDELKVRLTDVEGAHNLLEEHVKLVKEEMSILSEQCRIAEKDKKDAETRLEVLSNFFKEKEAKRQKEEAVWLQKQGEVSSTVERILSMQNEMQSYKQQIEVLRREIVDQEREYKSQIAALETKAHEQWVAARQNERRLEESKAEAGQLRNRLTLVEKNMNADADPDVKLHRLEPNGETATSSSLFMGADSSSSPIMFTGSSGVPLPPPPSYMHCSMFPPYLPPPLPSSLTGVGPGSDGLPPPPVSSYDPVGQRPPPLGGRLSSPPPPPLGGRYESTGSPLPPMSPHLLPPFDHHRSPAPPPPPIPSHFVPNDHHLPMHHHPHPHSHPPPPPPSGPSMLPPAAAVATTATGGHHLGATHSWPEETTLPPLRTSGFHPLQREQRVRNHKGSLHSSGESLDKTHHSGKV